jgi:exonuclease III
MFCKLWKNSLITFFVFSSYLSLKPIFAETECPKKPDVIDDRRSNKSLLRLAQYNAEWLFIDYYAASDCPGNGCSWKNQSEAQTHLTYIQKITRALNPDIINFAEVEGCDELNLLSENDETYLPYLKKGTDSATGQNVGILSRIDPIKDLYRTEERISYPVPGSKCGYTGAPGTSGVSKHYISEFGNILGTGYNVVLIGAHLLAFPTDTTRCAEREAQAQVLQNVIYNYFLEDYQVIVLGDLNDYDAEIMDVNNNKPNSQVLDILKGLGGSYKGKYELYSVSENINQTDRFSDWYDKNDNCISSSNEFSLLDHILISDLLREKMVGAFIYKEYTMNCDTYYSDHYPIIVDFQI